MLPLRHIHKRKVNRAKKYKNGLLDYAIYLFAFAGPIMTFPQIYDIWVERKITVNAITWGSYLLIGAVWLAYGVIHKEKPIIYSNLMALITNGLVFAGAIFLR